jgi:hypothetical protein
MKNYYVEKRTEWFPGEFTHKVMSRKLGKMICVSNDAGCEVVAEALNTIDSLHGTFNDDTKTT